MNNFRLSIDADSLDDSRGGSELYKLRDENKQKQSVIDEKSKIIASLREQLSDLQNEIEELEQNEQFLKQKNDRLQKELGEKDEELEAVSHALKEVEAANETMTKKLSGRTTQLQNFADNLAKTSKELTSSRNLVEQLQNKNELLEVELASVRSRKRVHRDEEDDFHELRSQISLLKQQNSNILADCQKYQQQIKHYQEDHEKKRILKEVEMLKNQINQLQQQNERLSMDLKNANSRKNSFSSSDREQTNEEMVQELYDLRAQVKSLSHRQSRRSIDEEITKLKQELDVTETSWRLERTHKERYARENTKLERQLHELSKEVNNLRQLREQMSLPPPPLPPKSKAKVQDENHTEATSAFHFSMAEEVGEIMDSSSVKAIATTNDKRALIGSSTSEQQSTDFRNKRAALHDSSMLKNTLPQPNYATNHRIQKSSFFNDPIAEEKMRLARANELARRNMRTKPLHQTSYPLELDTFDTTNLTEIDIKSGRTVATRPALADFSNQTKPAKKAEAFIV